MIWCATFVAQIAHMEKNKRETKRTKPTGVRFTIKDLDRIKEQEGLKTNQDVVDFLMALYNQTKFPILGVPTNDRYAIQQPQSAEKFTQSGKNTPAKLSEKSGNTSGGRVETSKEVPEMSDFMKKRQQSKLG
jgi:hypothetical protein